MSEVIMKYFEQTIEYKICSDERVAIVYHEKCKICGEDVRHGVTEFWNMYAINELNVLYVKMAIHLIDKHFHYIPVDAEGACVTMEETKEAIKIMEGKENASISTDLL